MGENPNRKTILPKKLWGNAVRHQTPDSQDEGISTRQSFPSHSTRFGIPIRSSQDHPALARIPEEKLKIEYHKSYNVDQAGPAVIALKDVEAFPTCLIKVRRIPKSWRFQAASHKNLISFIDFYHAHGLIYLVYEYEHLAISLGCVVGTADFSEADIATVCREVLNAIHYVHSELGISHGAVDCSNILLTWTGEVKLGAQYLLISSTS
jgi:serine/threonine protein kinase